jgi:hypothetical protein
MRNLKRRYGMEYKLIEAFPEEEYHALAAIGSSTVKDMSVSPAYYLEQKLARAGRPPSPAFAIGSMFHQAILEPGRENLFISEPEGLDKRTREGKAIWAEFSEQSEGRTIMKKSDYDNTIAMIEEFKSTEAYARMFKGDVMPEVTILGGPEGDARKCRFDLLKRKSGGYIAYDLKTTDAIPQSAADWQRFFIKWKYHIQAAWYIDVASKAGIEIKAFHFAVVSKRAPYDHAVVRLSSDFLSQGSIDGEAAYQDFLVCREKNIWPGNFVKSGSGSVEIDLPRWAVK